MAKPTDIRINPDALDQDCIETPGQILSASRDEAEARNEYTQAKNRLDLIEAQLTTKFRLNPKQNGLPDKPAMDLVRCKVIATKKYQEAIREVAESKRKLDAISAFVSALDAKKRLIGDLVDLHQTAYFSDIRPSSPAAKELHNSVVQKSVRKGVDL